MVEQPGSEKILEADMILLALGFLGGNLLLDFTVELGFTRPRTPAGERLRRGYG